MASAKKTRKTSVGLDIEPGHVAAVEVSANGSIVIERAATASLGPEVMRDGEVTDPDALAGTLRDLFKANKLGRRVRVGVANQRIVVRVLDLPPLENRKDLDTAVRFQAQEHIPMPMEQAVLDWHSLGLQQTPEGERTRVVVAAARRDMIERLLGTVRAAGLRPVGVDLSAFAMIRALGRDSIADGSPVLYLNVAGLTNLAVGQGGVCAFTRVVPGGLEGMVAQLAERRGLTLDHSRQWLCHVGLTAPVSSIKGEEEIVGEARSVLADGVHRIADEVRNSLDFYRNQEGGLGVERAVATGPAIAIPGLADQLGSDLGMPVQPGAVGSAAGALGAADVGHLTIAAGLAVEEAQA